MNTIWVLGDQLNRKIGALAGASPTDTVVLLVESQAMIEGRQYHRQRLHLVITAMQRFAGELERSGFVVDHRRSSSLEQGLLEHTAEFRPTKVRATEPNSQKVDQLFRRLDVELVRSDQFLCHREVFAEWADGRDRLRLEDFYRWQRRRLGYLMDGDQPAGGRWNYDSENRLPPPDAGYPWVPPIRSRLDELDREVLEALPAGLPGAAPEGWWATSRRAALARLRHFVAELLPQFGAFEDAMTSHSWHLAHSLLSPYLNLGLLLPAEVCDAVDDAYREGKVPINSAEGMIRQIIGWREFVWGISWLWPEQADANVFGHSRPLPPAWTSDVPTSMRCIADTLRGLHERGWVHHIQRLMILSNFANLYGTEPVLLREWMRDRFVDGANWVMGPNVMGLGLWADGGRMATKPYVSGGAYINRMSDYCRDCPFDPAQRTGERACPFTTLYWDFLARHRRHLEKNARMARQFHTMDRLSDLAEVRSRAAFVVESIARGEI